MTSYTAGSIACISWSAVMTEISCSTERPPKITATRVRLLCATLEPHLAFMEIAEIVFNENEVAACTLLAESFERLISSVSDDRL